MEPRMEIEVSLIIGFITNMNIAIAAISESNPALHREVKKVINDFEKRCYPNDGVFSIQSTSSTEGN